MLDRSRLQILFVLVLAGAGLASAQAQAASDKPMAQRGGSQDSGRDKDKSKDKDKDKKKSDDVESDFPPIADEPGVHKHFSPAEVKKICAQVEGQLIAFYDDIYRVEHCERRPLNDNKTVYNLQREGTRVVDVSSDVIAALPQGEPVDEAMSIKAARTCKQLEGSYVTYSNVDVYFVEHCKRRVFPDWMTYIKHRERRNDKKGEILSLSWIEFDRLSPGEPIRSIVDDMFARLLSGEAGVEVIPVDEACRGLEGRVASYYSYVYRIEKCHKRELVNAELYLKKLGVDKSKILEMNSEQWLSLPGGVPITTAPVEPPKAPTEFKPKWREQNKPGG